MRKRKPRQPNLNRKTIVTTNVLTFYHKFKQNFKHDEYIVSLEIETIKQIAAIYNKFHFWVQTTSAKR